MPDPIQSTPAAPVTVDSASEPSVELAMGEYVTLFPGLSNSFEMSVDNMEGEHTPVSNLALTGNGQMGRS